MLSTLAKVLMGGTLKGKFPNRRRQEHQLTQRQRKAIGTVLTIVSIVIWAIIGMWFYELWLVDAPNWAHLIFFVLFGLAWIFPAMIVIRWMAKPDS